MKKINVNLMRKDIIKMGYASGSTGAHFGGGLSLVEIMAVLYGKIMNFNKENPTDEKRDRLILSKGHGIMAQYAALKQLGLLSANDLLTFKNNNSFLPAHPSMNPKLGIEFSSGSLGQGLSLGVGTAIALRQKGNINSRVFVILGDGECDEGTIWEAAMSAAHYKLNNLIAIIDRNHLQYDGNTEDIMPLNDLEFKWKAFGWKTIKCDGHNQEELIQTLSSQYEQPLVIIANTIKGKGISFMENKPQWHNGVLTKSMYEIALTELEK